MTQAALRRTQYSYGMELNEANIEPITTEEWGQLTPAQRARRCTEMAEGVTKLASGASPVMKVLYEELAQEWLKLAEEIELTLN